MVANLSRFSQGVELDLQKYQGATLLEIFGVSRFPPITQEPYFLSLAPYSFYWFRMLPKEAGEELVTRGRWHDANCDRRSGVDESRMERKHDGSR